MQWFLMNKLMKTYCSVMYAYILKQKSLATQNLVDILFIIKIPVLKID